MKSNPIQNQSSVEAVENIKEASMEQTSSVEETKNVLKY